MCALCTSEVLGKGRHACRGGKALAEVAEAGADSIQFGKSERGSWKSIAHLSRR